MRGTKHDQLKPMYHLIPPNALEEVVEVLTIGSIKYSEDNWKKVPEGGKRYFSACMRHAWAWWRGEKKDEETGRSHLAHAICCLLFLLEKENFTKK